MPVHPFSLAADDPPGPYPGLELLATAVLLLDEKLELVTKHGVLQIAVADIRKNRSDSAIEKSGIEEIGPSGWRQAVTTDSRAQ